MTGKLRKMYMLSLALLIGIFFVQSNVVCAAEINSVLLEAAQGGNIYEVNSDGTRDFVTIQEGVDSVESGDTLLIYPGIYEENVVIENKTVNLIGVDPKYCILMANSDNYHHIPLTIAAGRVYGLTICGTGTEKFTSNLPNAEGVRDYDLANPESVYAWQSQYSGYAIHIDQEYSEGKTLSIENCRIISENNYCVGIGCWDSTEITITDCELISGGVSGCIFIHNTKYLTEVGTAQVTIKDSRFNNYVSPYVMVVHSEGTNNPIEFTFQNVKVSTVAYENNECYNESNINTWFPIDQLENPDVRAWLEENGYTNLLTELVHLRTEKQHRIFNDALEEQSSLLEDWPELAEGITYWESSSDEPVLLGRTRQNIDMKNTDEEAVGDGWCGLSGIYLTDASYGNTLPEMNYPKLLTE